MLPKVTGEEVCSRIRSNSSVPIIMLTAGADDYLTKPFSVRELVVRIRALLRRAYKNSIPMADILIYNNGDLEVDIKKMVVKKQSEVVSLTTNEFKILTILLTNPEQVFSREKLVEKAFGIDYEGFDRTMDNLWMVFGNRLMKDLKHLMKRLKD